MNCAYCDELLEDAELEFVPPEAVGVMSQFHRECRVRAAMGSAAHLLHECSCYGGTREDPPGMSLRNAAKLAFDTFLALRSETWQSP